MSRSSSGLAAPRLGWLSFDAGRRPDAWLLVVAATGWVVLAAGEVAARLTSSSGPGGMAMEHDGHHTGAGTPVVGVVAAQTVMWLAMIAIMLPLIAPNVRFAALRSPLAQRRGVTTAIVAGWSTVWVAAAVALAFATWLVAKPLGPAVAIGVVFAAAALWQWTPWKRRAAARCHRTCAPPLEPAAAGAACRRFGTRLGADCVASCWLLMAAMAAAGHALVAVAPLCWVAWYERRRRPHHDPRTTATAAVIVGTGAAALALTAWLGRPLH